MKIIKSFNQFESNKRIFEDVSEIAYSQISMSDRIIMSQDEEIKYRPTPTSEQQPWFKPKGLWYGIGSSWIDWVREEMPRWEKENIFEIEINMENMLILDSGKDIDEFTEEFEHSNLIGFHTIDWGKVSLQYGGVEITKKGMWEGLFKWMDTWDVPSGCLWGDNMLLSSRKIT
jgi:hypothetical protein